MTPSGAKYDLNTWNKNIIYKISMPTPVKNVTGLPLPVLFGRKRRKNSSSVSSPFNAIALLNALDNIDRTATTMSSSQAISDCIIQWINISPFVLI